MDCVGDGPPRTQDTGFCSCAAAPEGGQVWFEHVTYDSELQTALGLPGGVTTAGRVSAFFLDSETPQHNPLPNAGTCNNLVAGKLWPTHLGSSYVELDAGALVVATHDATGSPSTLTVPELGAGTDFLGRKQKTYYEVLQPNAASLMLPDSASTFLFGGAAGLAPAVFDQAIYLPASFTISAPDLENNGPLVAGSDFSVDWTPAISNTRDTALGVTWLADVNGVPTHMCLTLHSAGTFTIPGSSITEFKQIAQARGVASNRLILRRDAMILRIFLLPNGEPTNQRGIDVFSVVSYEQLMDVQ